MPKVLATGTEGLTPKWQFCCISLKQELAVFEQTTLCIFRCRLLSVAAARIIKCSRVTTPPP